MENSDKKIQDVSAQQANIVRVVCGEPTSGVAAIHSQTATVGNRQIKWWALALPIVVLIVIIAAHFPKTPVTTSAEGEKSWVTNPVLPKASILSRRLPDKFPNSGLVSGIAYSRSRALALIDDEMLPEGDIVYGVTIIKIHEDKVEFEKNGKRWTQKVGEQPDSRWR